ncbi:hypothetical protein [Tenacibaculum maritimum]|uniref:DUF2335 domain-containing protein n=2 Tax=Tenacibaculum maritimum TaxID=107401 RepID=A0A2H1E731_9FLAO|nr:hypothetical protein [Tenacibaculum maritimum]MCD9563713.1 hypothetical protein [Tenacibaculum maritimum]MCD9566341.1 hypothetical protein [Tenacibaculum maritimum]MCD9579702.1 hypothetical protein [Tenacibaculum maritimum]MCD9581991.1 hypothetical protein [Tenacibaculum maritimum]MCD9584998.1 hypothetical protein [Tenacibaculum maritimum]
MAKQKRKAQVTQGDGRKDHLIEETFDDSLLPDASEIEKLSQIDPEIINWLKSRAEKEQEFRHKTFNKKFNLVEKNENGLRWINYLGLILSFFLLAGGMFLSYTLIKENHEILGSAFTGLMLVAIASIFMSKVKSNNNEPTPK